MTIVPQELIGTSNSPHSCACMQTMRKATTS